MLDILAAFNSDLPFEVAYARAKCIRAGHRGKGTLLEKLRSERHGKSDTEMVYTVNVMYCRECQIDYLDAGMEFRV